MYNLFCFLEYFQENFWNSTVFTTPLITNSLEFLNKKKLYIPKKTHLFLSVLNSKIISNSRYYMNNKTQKKSLLFKISAQKRFKHFVEKKIIYILAIIINQKHIYLAATNICFFSYHGK